MENSTKLPENDEEELRKLQNEQIWRHLEVTKDAMPDVYKLPAEEIRGSDGTESLFCHERACLLAADEQKALSGLKTNKDKVNEIINSMVASLQYTSMEIERQQKAYKGSKEQIEALLLALGYEFEWIEGGKHTKGLGIEKVYLPEHVIGDKNGQQHSWLGMCSD